MKLHAVIVLLMSGHLAVGADLQPIFALPQKASAQPGTLARTPFGQLVEAIQYNKTKAIHDLVEQQDNLIDQTDADKWSLLHFAAHFGNLSAVKYLHTKIKARWFQSSLLNGRTNETKQTPLGLAIMANHLDVVKYLVEECQAEYGEADLISSVAFGRVEILGYLNNKLNKVYSLSALNRARNGGTSAEMLFLLGNIIDYASLSAGSKNLFKIYVQEIFKHYSLPISCEFIRGYEQQNNNNPTVAYDQILSKEIISQVRDFNQHPEKYVGF